MNMDNKEPPIPGYISMIKHKCGQQVPVVCPSCSRFNAIEENTKSTKQFCYPDAFNFILAYMDVGYFFCFIPFRCKFNNATGSYHILEYFPQKLFTIILFILHTVYFLIWYPSLAIQLSYSSDPVKLFRITETLINLLHTMLFTHMLLFKKSEFQLFIKLAQQHIPWTETASGARKKSVMKFGIFILYMALGTFIYPFYISAPPANTKSGGELESLNEATSWIISVLNLQDNSILSLLFNLRRSTSESVNTLLFAFGWYLKQLCEQLRVNELGSLQTSHAKILDQYVQIKNINESLNAIVKYMMFAYVIGSIPFVSSAIMDFRLTDPTIIFRLLFAGYGLISSMIGSAEANSKACQLKHALLERQILQPEQNIDPISIQMLLSEFSQPDIGLKGTHFFTVTYGFVGVMLSQCIVYALIILQLRGPSSSS